MPFLIPTNNVVLYSGIQITDGEQIVFSSSSRQNQYFAAHKEAEFLDCTYIRKTGYVRLEIPTRTAMNCNYMSFTNNGFENKTFYARIIDWKYVNNVTTDILYEIDWFQSKMFDFTMEPCFVEREHLTVGETNTVNGNPYTEDVPALMTSEPIPMARSMERRYEASASGSNDEVKRLSFHRSAGYCVMMYLAGYEMDPDDADLFEAYFDVVIYSDGHIAKFPKGSNPYHYFDGNVESISDLPWALAVPNAYDICIRSCNDDSWREGFMNALKILVEKNATHNILGIYYVPNEAVKNWLNGNFGATTNTITIQPYQTYADDTAIVNKKLLRSPFQYIRAMNCKGDIKEYFFEKFFGTQGTFRIAMTADPVPIISMFPFKYCVKVPDGAATNTRANNNVDERMDYGYLPQVGYCIDSYLSFLSNMYLEQCATRTKWDEINSTVNLVSAGLGTVAGVATGIAGGTKGDMGAVGVGINSAMSSFTSGMQEFENRDIRDALDQARWGDNNKADELFGKAKASFVSNEYHAGVTSTLFAKYYGLTVDDTIGAFVLERVRPTDKILKMMDDYFSCYGYTANVIKVPNVCEVLKGHTGDSSVNFDTAIPEYSTGRTYCKTRHAHVICDGGAAINKYIESLFDNGCFFLNGDNLS